MALIDLAIRNDQSNEYAVANGLLPICEQIILLQTDNGEKNLGVASRSCLRTLATSIRSDRSLLLISE